MKVSDFIEINQTFKNKYLRRPCNICLTANFIIKATITASTTLLNTNDGKVCVLYRISIA